VIEAVCRYLEHDGHRIISRSATRQRGIDIVAEHSGAGRVLVEAKCETSARTSGKRHGKAFDAAQVRDHVANAVYTGARLQGKGDTEKCLLTSPFVGYPLGLPDGP
jgi:Uncharacterised protein family UPF0102